MAARPPATLATIGDCELQLTLANGPTVGGYAVRYDANCLFIRICDHDLTATRQFMDAAPGGDNRPSGPRPVPPPPAADEIRRGLRDTVVDQLSTGFAIFDGELQEALFKAAGTSDSGHFQNSCLRAINLLQQQSLAFSDELVSGIDRRVTDTFYNRRPPPDADDNIDADDELSVVPKEVFEDHLQLHRIAGQIRNNCAVALDCLVERCALVAGVPIRAGSLPFGPAWLTRQLSECDTLHRLPDDIRPVLYNTFEQVLLHRYPTLVDILNQQLRDCGVMPDLETSPRVIRTQRSAPGPARARRSAPLPHEPVQTVASDQLYASALSMLQLSAGGAGVDANIAVLEPSNRYYSREQVISALSALPNDVADASLGATVRAALDAQHGAGDRNVNEETMRHITLVERIFDHAIQSLGSADEARPTLLQLQIPVLEIGLLDPGFFTDSDNPARSVIDLLARLCRPVHYHNAVTRRQIEQTVARICGEVDQYPEVFTEIRAELEGTVQRQQLARQRHAERLALMLDGRERLARARRAVEEELYRRYGRLPMPTVLIELLDCGWRDVLVQQALRHGVDSEPWQTRFAELDQLHRWLSPESGADLPTDDEVRALLDSLSGELEEHAANAVQADGLGETLARVLSEGKATEYLDAYPAPSDDATGSSGGPHLRRWEERCRELTVGDWFAAAETGGELMRLAWVDDHRERFVFVDEQGHELKELTRNELAQKLREGLMPVDSPEHNSAVDDGLLLAVHDVFAELAGRARRDSLTDLLNRQAFEQNLRASLTDASEPRIPILIGCDIDQFRLINQYHGHHAGDALLRACGALLAECAPPDAPLARLDSNTFSILLSGTDHAAAEALAEKWRQAVENYRFCWNDDVQNVTASIGIVALDQNTRDDVSAFKLLGSAISRAKAGGGNRRYTWGEDDIDGEDRMLAWVTRLGSILEQNRLRLRCQRIQPSLQTGDDNVHHEILLGVLDEHGTLQPPVELITAAERFNRMDTIDRWVVRSFLQWCHDNPDKFGRLGTVSLNLSGNSIGNDQFIAFLLNELDQTTVPLDRICFEITETATIANLANAADVIRSVKERGCRFALDDFGTGLSSFEYLKRLPVDYLKIDGVFVKDVVNSDADRALVQAINQIAHALGKASIAEYVETDETLAVIRELGVDFAQGWSIGRPFMLAEL